MYKLYFKQALEMLKQNKFISLITIIGTALAIMMIMVVIVTQSIKNSDIAPEINRNRMMHIKIQQSKAKNNNGSNSRNVNSEVYKNYLSKLKTPELVSAMIGESDKCLISSDARSDRLSMKVNFVDDAYWRVMSFSFVEGKPFSREDFEAGFKKAVVTQSLARTLLGSEDAVGQTIQIDFKPYTIVGVVKDASPVFKFAYAGAYVPYTSKLGIEMAGFHILFLAKSPRDFEAIQEEVREAERRFDATDPEWSITFLGPYNHKLQQLKYSVFGNEDLEKKGREHTRKMVFIVTVLLLIPAVNLSSFSMSRIKRRTEEIGVRKAFGARKHVILVQVLYENFITSLIGGFIGLVLSYLVVLWLKGWLLGVEAGGAIPLHTLVSAPVFLAVFVVCLLMNLLSAGLPAYRASRITLIDSLNKKND